MAVGLGDRSSSLIWLRQRSLHALPTDNGRAKPGHLPIAPALPDYSPTYVGMPAASNVVTAGSIDFATLDRASATVEWIDQGPRMRTKAAMTAAARMVRIGVPPLGAPVLTQQDLCALRSG
jgi:hypothetical protein